MFPTLSIRSDLDRLAGWASWMGNEQLPFATSVALNATAGDGATAITRRMPKDLDRPTSFTMRAWTIKRSTKRSLTAWVLAKDAQAEYLRWQVAGGARQPKRTALRLPGAIKLDAHGNLPKGEIARLVRAAQAGKRVTRRRGERIGVSSKLDLFYGDPGDGRPAGIYKRIVRGEHHTLLPVIVFPRQSARYRARLPLQATVAAEVKRQFSVNFRSAWARALRTRR